MPDSLRADVESIAQNERAFGFLLAIHGGVHVFGWALSWQLFEIYSFRYDDVWPDAGTWPGRAMGVVWLVAAGALVVVGARMAAGRSATRLELAGAAGLSVAVTATALPAAAPGLAISAAVLVAMVVLTVRRATHHPSRQPPRS